MASQSHCPDTAPVVWNVRSRANSLNPQKHAASGNSPIPPAKRHISVPAGERDSSAGGSSVGSTIQGPNSAPSTLLNNSSIAEITQCLTATLSATQQRSINTPTATAGTCSHNTPAPRGTSETVWKRDIVSSPASSIASTPTPLRGLENLPSAIANPEARTIITNPLRTRATDRDQRQRHGQLQPQAVCTPESVVYGSLSIQQRGHSDMTRLEFAMGSLLEVYMWNRWPCMSASDCEKVRYAMWRVAKALTEALHWQIIAMYWNTAMQQNIVWSIALEAHTKDSLKEVCWSNSPRWILHAQTGTRFEHKSLRLNPIEFTQQGTMYVSFMISTAFNPTRSTWNSSNPFWQTISIFFLKQGMRKVVYTVQIQRRES